LNDLDLAKVHVRVADGFLFYFYKIWKLFILDSFNESLECEQNSGDWFGQHIKWL
jgi:hypothetical protein